MVAREHTLSRRMVAVLGVALAGWGCASAPRRPAVDCSRVVLEPAPPWTVSVVWHEAARELAVLDPARGGFALYDRSGRRQTDILLDPGLELDFAAPMRLERVGNGYELLTRTRQIRLDTNFTPTENRALFEVFAPLGWSNATVSDGVFVGDVFYGYADAIDQGPTSGDGGEGEIDGTWRRGFVRLDRTRARLDWLLELPLDASAELSAYYFYDRRPYVATLDGEVYVLRLSEPWSLHRVAGGGLRQLLAGGAEDPMPMALYAWNKRLYVLFSRTVAAESEADEIGAPELDVPDPNARAALLAVQRVEGGHRAWIVREIDPRRRRVVREVELPSRAERLRLIPGHELWLGVEESSAPNLGDAGHGARALFLPAQSVATGQFSCPWSTDGT